MTATPDLALLADKMELTELVARLERAVDRMDRDGILACYSEKSFDDHGRFRGSREEFAEFICNNPGFTSASSFIYHLMGQSLFDVEGDEAYGESYFAYWMQTSEDRLYQSIGRYLDYFQRTEDGWRITYRRVVMEWDGTVPCENAVPGGHFRGTRDQNDPLYKRLKWPENPETKTSIG
ncbi:nuclear transport factor 2 family protein [Nocardioides sp. NPDC101246]|uniref:nuclear transport factor 2 family protein n=1 Tax=Nocardioides sp. NPDC101246 TaxID=3364336 RepID=UPI0037FA20C7